MSKDKNGKTLNSSIDSSFETKFQEIKKLELIAT